ncbi:helix-turn-helix domain-containing protein [Streptomyces panaciradicis]|uniref:helix-turn-helix domain-containing protein n=1 Tax=Streptomyces panaciradicis TaxID=1470261 RepID=UPI00201D2AD4|nr:helix-turn-helix domain-containing protein [Streptomyces panaciradicis]MCL6671190.1 helix-turn-helix domain-containing protein [Streptomyces panaciradicis]
MTACGAESPSANTSARRRTRYTRWPTVSTSPPSDGPTVTSTQPSTLGSWPPSCPHLRVKGESVSAIAKALGVSRATLYRHLGDDS